MLYDFKQTSRQSKNRLTTVVRLFPFLLILSLATFFAPALKQMVLSPPSGFDQLKKEVLKHPGNPQAHFRLADFFFQANDLDGAKKELALALSLDPNHQEARSLKVQIREQEQEPEKLKVRIENWEKILTEKPGYRDAYFQLAILNWQIYEEEKSFEVIDQVFELDPNFETAKDFKKILLE